jgi:alkyl hydroperoxide reductase subunit AhpF
VAGRGGRALVAVLELASLARRVYFLPTMALDPTDARTEQVRHQENVEVLDGWELVQILGDEFVTQVAIVHGYDDRILDVEGVFVELGLVPNKEFARGVVDFDPETGRIPINHRCETGTPGLFAAGDVTDIFAEQVPVAIGEGIKAAISAWEYLVLRDAM